MKNVGAMHRQVKNSRNGIRRPPRSRERAEDRRDERVEPDADDDRDRQQRVAVALAELAVVDEVQPDRPDTTAKQKIVLAKSYRAHDGRDDRPAVGVRPASPRAVPTGVAGPRDGPRRSSRGAMIAGHQTRRIVPMAASGSEADRAPARQVARRRSARRSSGRVAGRRQRPDRRAAVGRRPASWPRSTKPAASCVDEDGDVTVERLRRIVEALASVAAAGRRARPRRLPHQAGDPDRDRGPSPGRTRRRSMGSLVGLRRNRAVDTLKLEEARWRPRRSPADDVVSFVAIDLLWLDDESAPRRAAARAAAAPRERSLDESDLVRRRGVRPAADRPGSGRGAPTASPASPSRPPTAATARASDAPTDWAIAADAYR